MLYVALAVVVTLVGLVVFLLHGSHRLRLHLIRERRNPEFNVVFVHGVQGDWYDTWNHASIPAFGKDKSSANYWPAMVAKRFPTASVWSLEYPAVVSHWFGSTMALRDRAVSLLNYFRACHLNRLPTVFVTHSLGGLVIKAFWRAAHEMGQRDVIASVKGIVFIATPHRGAAVADILSECFDGVGCADVGRKTATLDELTADNPCLLELDNWYRKTPIPRNWAFFETKPTGLTVVVDRDSADPKLPGVVPVPVDANHSSICKPEDGESPIAASVSLIIEEVTQST